MLKNKRIIADLILTLGKLINDKIHENSMVLGGKDVNQSKSDHIYLITIYWSTQK